MKFYLNTYKAFKMCFNWYKLAYSNEDISINKLDIRGDLKGSLPCTSSFRKDFISLIWFTQTEY